MNMPGFTAEVSIYRSTKGYLLTSAESSVQGVSFVKPQFLDEEVICGSCIHGRQFCRVFRGGHLIFRGWGPCGEV
jgi:hypothetical protein